MSEALDVDVLSREEQKREPLYAGRVKVYPKKVDGTLRRIKWAALIGLLTLYYVGPWIRWDRGPDTPDQALLLDLPNRRFYFFWMEIWPQEIYYLTGLLMLGAFGLFLATAIGGRVWCGFTCPQTVWTDLFMWVERLVEGDRNARMRLDDAPLTADKAKKKVLKHGAWLLIALLTGGAWIMYFKDAPTLVSEFFTGEASFSIYFFVGLFTFTTYLLAGWAREQVCTYMCPWPRFQAALLDEDSLVVTYRDWRGEPRGKHKRGDSWKGRGDCIDCKQCVSVCPTGVDIRDGIQLECIGCGLCIDACDTVMDKVDRPRGLIAFDTERNMQLGHAGRPGHAWTYRLLRPRTILYVVLLVAIAAFMLFSLGSRATVDLTVIRDRNPLFVTLSDGSIRNGYTVRILNKTLEPRDFTLAASRVPEARLTVLGRESQNTGDLRLTVAPNAVGTYRIFVTVPPGQITDESMPMDITVTALDDGESMSHDTVFRGPQ